MKYILLLITSGLIFISCRKINEPEFKSIENVSIKQLAPSPIITLNMRYFNPNRFNAKLKEAEGDAWVDSAYLGHFRVDTLVQIPAQTEFLVPVNLAVDSKYMSQFSFSTLSKKEVLVRIQGNARAGRNGVFKRIHLKYEGKQRLSEILDVGF